MRMYKIIFEKFGGIELDGNGGIKFYKRKCKRQTFIRA